MNSVKTLIYWSKLSKDFWSFASIYANHLYIITPRKSISNLIPNEIFYNTKVDITPIKVFGCTAFYNNLQNKKSKIDINSKEGIFLGIKFDTHCYIIMDKTNQKFHLVREGNIEEVKKLIRYGMKINKKNKDGGTPLLIECKNGNRELIKYKLS